MLITKEDSGKCATRMLKFMNRNGISSLQDLDHFMNSKHYIGDPDLIEISERPQGNFLIYSAKSTPTIIKVITYARTDIGALLEIRINTDKQYSIILVRGDFTLEKYAVSGTDKFGNKSQERKIHSIYVSKIKEELEKLI